MKAEDVPRAKILVDVLPELSEFFEALETDDTPKDGYNECGVQIAIAHRNDHGSEWETHILIDKVTARIVLADLARVILERLDDLGVQLPPISPPDKGQTE